MGSLRESNAEVLNAEVVFPFQITAWRDAARDRGIDSVQAKQFRAGILEIISDAIDAARAEGDRRVVALMEKYGDAMRNHAGDVLIYDIDYSSGCTTSG